MADTAATEVSGLVEELSGATSMNQMFVSCPSLETIWADGFTSSARAGRSCSAAASRLVGGQGYVPGQMEQPQRAQLTGWTAC
mgnify:CR=1 FL=1